mmetsp:Transcript_2111/g.4365  ORF Transcript_2111/g.4365 Transcript_2111/m.4365 type:complete len:106 (-) Transcript_2111:298-615(-)
MSQQQQHHQQQPNNFLENMKKATSKIGSTLVDAGAKTMLKTDMVFLERDIKSKKTRTGAPNLRYSHQLHRHRSSPPNPKGIRRNARRSTKIATKVEWEDGGDEGH